jgi:NAD(P)H-nitrite reductase large subunit
MQKIWYPLEDLRVTLHLGCRAQTLNAADKTVIDHLGNHYHFDKLLIATGGDTIKLPFGSQRFLI